MRLTDVDPAQHDGILDSTYPLWGEGLSRDAYGRWNQAQLQTTWGRDHLRRVALVREGEVMASAKRYDLTAVVGGESMPVLGIGAVFTPTAHRGQGHAASLLRAMHIDAQARGCRWALLFSEIGPDYYERLGYRAMPQVVQTIAARRDAKRGAPAVLLRSGESSDLPHIAEISARDVESASFALDRSADFIGFGVTKRRLLAGLSNPGVRQLEFFVTEEGTRAVAFVVVSRGAAGLVLEDYGDRDPTGARVGAMLQVLDARLPADQPLRLRSRRFRAGLPPQVSLVEERPAAEIMMLRPIGSADGDFADADWPDPDRIVYRGLDVF